MTHSDQAAMTDAAPLPRAPRKLLLFALGALALVLAAGGVWTFTRYGAHPSPAVIDVQPAAHHGDMAGDVPHADAPAAVDAHADGGHANVHAAEAAGEAAGHGHDETDAHGHAESAVQDDATTAHGGTADSHADGGHTDKGVAVPLATKQIVLAGFAGVNGLAIVIAAILRRRYPPRLPKHLQR